MARMTKWKEKGGPYYFTLITNITQRSNMYQILSVKFET